MKKLGLMMAQDNGASLRDRAFAASPSSQQAVSPVPASIPSAGCLPNITYLSCSLCYGARVTQWGPCGSCADPDPVRARWMLERLSEGQIDFLRAFGHTLAYQPITKAENDAHRCEYFVEGEDGVFDEDAEFWIVPHTRHWFASGMHKSGPNGWASFIQYNPTGLMLRECLMCGPTMNLPHMYPARHAQGIEARSGQTEGLDPKGESAAANGDAP